MTYRQLIEAQPSAFRPHLDEYINATIAYETDNSNESYCRFFSSYEVMHEAKCNVGAVDYKKLETFLFAHLSTFNDVAAFLTFAESVEVQS